MAKTPVATKPPQKLTEFIDAFSAYASSTPEMKCYRGQRDASWKDVAGLFRPGMEKLHINEKRAVRDLISVHPQEFEHDRSMLDKLVRMQHFGLPTRLLDVSMNALVALYFASEQEEDLNKTETDGLVIAYSIPEEREKYFDSDSVSCLSNLANMTDPEKKEIDSIRASLGKGITVSEKNKFFNTKSVVKRLHFFIKAEKPYFEEKLKYIDLFKPYFVHPKLSNRRILAQSGAFIIFGIDPPSRMRFAHPISPQRFIIPAAMKGPIRKGLENLGINDSTLFPELDRAAARIKREYTR